MIVHRSNYPELCERWRVCTRTLNEQCFANLHNLCIDVRNDQWCMRSLLWLVPEYLSNLFEKNSTRNVRKLRNTDADLSLPLRKSNNGQKAISFRGPKLWNQLKPDAKQAPSLVTFKRRIKNWLWWSFKFRGIYLLICKYFCHGPLKSNSHGLTGLPSLNK